MRVKLNNRTDKKVIESKIIKLVTGYVDESDEIDKTLTPEQVDFIKENTARVGRIWYSVDRKFRMAEYRCIFPVHDWTFHRNIRAIVYIWKTERYIRTVVSLPASVPRKSTGTHQRGFSESRSIQTTTEWNPPRYYSVNYLDSQLLSYWLARVYTCSFARSLITFI